MDLMDMKVSLKWPSPKQWFGLACLSIVMNLMAATVAAGEGDVTLAWVGVVAAVGIAAATLHGFRKRWR